MKSRFTGLWPLAARAPFALVASVLGMRLMDEWMAFLPSGAFEAFRSELGLSYRDAATIITLMGVGAIAGSGFTVLADTRSRRVIATIGGYGYAASIATFGLGHSPAVLALGAIGIGMFSTALVDAIEISLVDVAGDRLEVLLARINLGATIGDFIGPVVLASITAFGGSWRTALIVSAIAMAAFATIVAAAPLPAPGSVPHVDDGGSDDEADSPELPRGLPAIVAVLRAPSVWWAGLLGAGLVALDESYLGFIIAGFEEERGTTPAVSVALGSSSVVGAAIASIWLARRTPFWEPRRRMIATALVMAVAAALFAVLPTLWLPTLAILVFDAAMIGFWLPLQALALRLVPGRAGTTKAVIGAIEMLGLLIPVGIGALADSTDLQVGLLAYAVVPTAMLALTLSRRPPPVPAARARVRGGRT